MAVRRWDPVRDLVSIQNEMNRLFGRTYGSDTSDTEPQAHWAPPVDIFQIDDKFTIVAELPGMTTGDVDITVEDAILTICGDRKYYEGIGDDAFHRVERRFGSFIRRVALPPHSDTSNIEASMQEGLLRIEVPKAEQAKPKRIEVKATQG